MSEEDRHGDGFLSFSQTPEDGNRSRQFHRGGGYRGNKQNNRQRFGFGYNQPQQPYHNRNFHNRSQQNRSYRQDHSFNKREDSDNIEDYIHPSMWQDPWKHFKSHSDTANDSSIQNKDVKGGTEDAKGTGLDEDLNQQS